MRNLKAFTLVELLVVIAIIALLISILAPALTAAKALAELTVCKSQLNTVTKGINLYGELSQGHLPPFKSRIDRATARPTADPHDKVGKTTQAADKTEKDTVTGQFTYRSLAHLYKVKTIETPDVLYCPWYKGRPDEHTRIREAYPDPWPMTTNIKSSNYVYISYIWGIKGKFYPHVGPNGTWDLAYKTLSELPSDKPLIMDLLGEPWYIWGLHPVKGYENPTFNVACADGSVDAYANDKILEFLWSGKYNTDTWEEDGDDNDFADLLDRLFNPDKK